MSFSRILQRRMRPLKYASDNDESKDVYSQQDLLTSDDRDKGGDKESHPQDESAFQSSREEDTSPGIDVRPESNFHQARS